MNKKKTKYLFIAKLVLRLFKMTILILYFAYFSFNFNNNVFRSLRFS